MGFWESLRKGVNINFVNVDLSSLKEVNILSNNQSKKVITISLDEEDPNIARIEINHDQLHDPKNEDQKKALLKALKAHIEQGDGIIAEQQTGILIENVGQFVSTQSYKHNIEWLKDKIPQEDLLIWEAALYIRDVHERGENVSILKRDVMYRYGDKGRNIANLCSAGYLESVIKPMYEELSKHDDFNKEDFLSQYKVIVDKYPFAIFVGRATNDEEASLEIRDKIQYNKKYGTYILNIHAIGEDNIKKVQRILESDEMKSQFSKLPMIKIDGGVLSATIYFNEDIGSS